MNGLQVADMGQYKDRHIWLCYHHQNPRKTQIAIEWDKKGEGVGYDIVSNDKMPLVKVNIVDGVACVENLEELKPYCKKLAKFIYDMDNDQLRFK